VRSLISRLAAVTVLIVLPLSAWVQCAGWQSTAEARMACCAQEAQCPMHSQSRSGRHERVTQTQADTCCALSERSPSTPSSSSHLVAPVTLTLTSTPAPVVLSDLASLRVAWQDFVPIVISPVPRHLLLSVFLV
jgi:hypothetical protein